MSAAAPSAVWRLGRLRRVRAPREIAAPTGPRAVVISARRTHDAALGSIEQVEHRAGRIEILLRLPDGSSGTATVFDDGVNSLELEPGATVFVLPGA